VRRVATWVASGASSAEVFSAVAEETLRSAATNAAVADDHDGAGDGRSCPPHGVVRTFGPGASGSLDGRRCPRRVSARAPPGAMDEYAGGLLARSTTRASEHGFFSRVAGWCQDLRRAHLGK